MARKFEITRSIEVTKAIVLGMNTETCEPFNRAIEVKGTFKTTDKLMKALQKMVGADEAFVKVISSEVINKMYGMTADDFIAHATELDPFTRKALEQDTEETTESVEEN